MFKKNLFILSVLFCFILFSCVPSNKKENSIQIKGSDTMINLVQAWIEEFMKQDPKLCISVTGGGSGNGIASLLNKTCDIASSSRKIEQEELEIAKNKQVEFKEFIVGMDGIVVVIHPSNPIEKLTISQLSDVFTGKITNWKELGGKNAKIVILSRECNSGTYVYFKEHVLGEGKEYIENTLFLPSSQSIADEVAQNVNAIGYYGIGYISPKQKNIAVAKDNNSPFVFPTIESVKNNSYFISRPLLMYTNGEPSGAVKKFIDFILSEQGQKIVEKINFVPIR
ncbi:MAG: phosphate ABC transporter substrate-binding protein [bacterium]